MLDAVADKRKAIVKQAQIHWNFIYTQESNHCIITLFRIIYYDRNRLISAFSRNIYTTLNVSVAENAKNFTIFFIFANFCELSLSLSIQEHTSVYVFAIFFRRIVLLKWLTVFLMSTKIFCIRLWLPTKFYQSQSKLSTVSSPNFDWSSNFGSFYEKR